MNNENIIKWLHFSDIHIGHQDYVETIMREELPAYISQLTTREKFDLIFITGDLIYAPEYINQAQEIADISPICNIIKKLQSASKVDNGHTCIVIGNHDAIRTKDKDCAVKRLVDSYTSQKGEVENLDTILIAESRFSRLYQQILEKEYPLQGHFIRTVPLTSAKDKIRLLDVLHLDTLISAEAVLNDEKTRILQDGNLIIGTKLLHTVLKKRNDFSIPIIAIGHHPLSAFRSEEREAIIREFEEAGISIYLCGHTHLAEIKKYGNNLLQICCGTNMEKLENQNSADMIFFSGAYDLNKKSFSIKTHRYNSRSNGKINGWELADFPVFEQIQFEKDIGETVFYYPKKNAPYFSIIEKYSKQIEKNVVDPEQYVDITPIINQKRPMPQVENKRRRIYEADAGFGKTMFLRKKISDIVNESTKKQYSIREALLSKEIKCPFYINLESKLYGHNEDSFIDLLAKTIHLSKKSSIKVHIFTRWIMKLAESGRLILLIDGFEKLEGKMRDNFADIVLDFLSVYPETEVLITAKYFAFDNIDIQKKFEGFAFYQLESFENEQICQYCVIWYRNEWENKDEDSSLQNRAQEIATQILKDPSLKELARVPLLLYTLLQVNKSLNTLPKNRIRLYDSFVYALLKENPYPESDIELLAVVALKMQRERISYFSTNRVKRIIQTAVNTCDWLPYSANRKIHVCDFLEEINRNSRLLKKQENVEKYVFYNDIIQDYLASVALVKGYYEELQPWIKKQKKELNDKISNFPLVTQMKELWDYVENRNMVILTILQLNAYETYIVMEALLSHIDNDEVMNQTSVEVNSNLRNLLLQVILNGANITREQRKRAFLAVQKNNLFDLQADLLEEVFNSRFSAEFEETCSRYISELFRLLKEEENPIQYICDKIWSAQILSINNQKIEEALYVLDGIIWSRGREYLDVYQKTNTIKELVDMLEHILKSESDELCKRRVCGVFHRLLKNETIAKIDTSIIRLFFDIYETDSSGMNSLVEEDYIYAGIRIFDAIPLDEDTIFEIKLFGMEDQKKEHYKQLYQNAKNPQDRVNAFQAAVFCKCWNQEDIYKILEKDQVFQSKLIDRKNLMERMNMLVKGHFFE